MDRSHDDELEAAIATLDTGDHDHWERVWWRNKAGELQPVVWGMRIERVRQGNISGGGMRELMQAQSHRSDH